MKVLEHDKHREMQALSRKVSAEAEAQLGGWMSTVPFPGIGMTNLRLSAGEIFNFATTVAALDVAPGDRVLDLGAGSCWVSDWLNRMLVKKDAQIACLQEQVVVYERGRFIRLMRGLSESWRRLRSGG